MIEIKENKIYASRDIEQYEIIGYLSGPEASIRSAESIEVIQGMYVVDETYKLLEHSYDPNIRISLKQIKAIRDIKKGEELKRNYLDTESEIIQPFRDKETGELVDRDEWNVEFNKQYHQMLRDILEQGVEKEDRTGVGTISLFNYSFKINVEKSFPLLTTKKVPYRNIFSELLWFLSGSTNIQYLEEQKNPIWTAWSDEDGELGIVYPWYWRNIEYRDDTTGELLIHDQIKEVIKSIKENPDSRRHIVASWNPVLIKDANLPPCHNQFQFFSFVKEGKRYLSLKFNMRSNDVFLGHPFNIASYTALLYIIAHLTDHIPYEVAYSGTDVHIYKNHLEQVEKLLSRSPLTYPHPKLVINNLDKFDLDDPTAFSLDNFEVVGYQSYSFIKAPVAV